MNRKIKKSGFTIIEVVLVLAIAGLIFIMVFAALPALQSSQRDTARKNDVGIVITAVTNYSSANRGAFPTTDKLTPFITTISTNSTSVTVGTDGLTSVKPEDGVILITRQTTCGESSADEQVLVKGTQRQYTVVTKLESGGGVYYCSAG